MQYTGSQIGRNILLILDSSLIGILFVRLFLSPKYRMYKERRAWSRGPEAHFSGQSLARIIPAEQVAHVERKHRPPRIRRPWGLGRGLDGPRRHRPPTDRGRKSGPVPRVSLEPFHSQEWSMSNFPCSLTSNITSHTMENSAFHSFTQMQDYYTFNSHYLTYTIAL